MTFALIDCNNFFASCERAFDPSLMDRPVAVLSNNDGCIVARSNEVKALDIPMAAPYFKYKDILDRHNVAVFSSNYELYGDMSNRVMDTVESFAHDTEVYSIDEAFINFHDLKNPEDEARTIRDTVTKWTGIPTSIGVASTKTLSKIANHIAKKHTKDGVFSMLDQDMQDRVLAKLPVGEIWGVGRKNAVKLNNLGIYTAKDLRDKDPKYIRKQFSVTGERIVHELRGTPCMDLEDAKPRQNIMSSRSFGSPVTKLTDLEEAISTYSARACEKARHQRSKASGFYVYIRTNQFKTNEPQYRRGALHTFAHPTSNSAEIIAAAKESLRKIYREGYNYKKAGILLTELVPEDYHQGDLFTAAPTGEDTPLMQTIDMLNAKMGRDTVSFAAQGTTRPWQMKKDLSSPRYTTRWDEIPVVRC
ncbi:MAG: Y-family DNA polymerase [Alphaproteobacteria bacterium]|nr:Y-family DNA polymerase [Alphaproteobacteria bacterium]